MASITVSAQLAQAAEITVDNPGGVESSFSPDGIPSGPTGPERHTFPGASALAHITGGLNPSGANDFSCTPKSGQYPVILIAGTSEDAYSTWAYYAPELARRGFCVFAPNYNPMTSKLLDATDWAAFSGEIKSSAAFLAGFVDRVLAATGASKVDLVGHSQGGGALPRAYIKWYGGETKVHQLVGIVPSNHGTTAYGLQRLLKHINYDAGMPVGDALDALNMRSLPEQLKDSDFVQELNAGTETYPGIIYNNVSTKYDDVLLPYTSTFLKGANNMVVQDYCSLDHTDHFGATYDPIIFTLVLHSLDPSNTEPVRCQLVLPVFQ